MHPVEIDITLYIERIADWITQTFGALRSVYITFGFGSRFSLFDIFTYSAGFILFVKIFVRRWIPNFDFHIESKTPADVRIDGEPSLDINDIDRLMNLF